MALFHQRHHAAHVLHARRAGFGDQRGDRGLGFFLGHLLGQEALDHRDFGGFDRGQFGAAAGGVHLDRFAALFDHFLEDIGDHRVVLGLDAGGAQLDIAVLDRRADHAQRLRACLVAALHRAHQRGLEVVANHLVPVHLVGKIQS